MSGLIDVNVSVCSGTDLEDFTSVTKCAAAGGFTTIVDNPMFSIPPATSLKNLKTKISHARKSKLHCDVGFWVHYLQYFRKRSKRERNKQIHAPLAFF